MTTTLWGEEFKQKATFFKQHEKVQHMHWFTCISTLYQNDNAFEAKIDREKRYKNILLKRNQ